MIDLLSERVGGRVVACNDEFFAPASNLLTTTDPVWKEGEYTDHGKWMDGWETRRRRDAGHDWCVLALGIPGQVARVVVDTTHFTGNHPQQFSLEGAGVGDPGRAEWVELIAKTVLSGDTVATFEVTRRHRFELLRLNIFPDGGVARLRVEGEPIPGMQDVCPDGPVDLASAKVGGEVVDASDMHYSHPANVLRPGDSAGMWDGWETRRRRDAGHDWIAVRLGLTGVVEQLVVDTTHFKGNAPGWVSAEVSDDGVSWMPAVPRVPVRPDLVNRVDVSPAATARLVRLSIHPDGGLARFRVLGKPDAAGSGQRRLEYVNSLLDQPARMFFGTACAARRWVTGMAESRPFSGIDDIFEASERVFDRLGEPDWLEAFASHPRIGERGDATADREQSSTSSATREVLRDLVEVNREYESEFGFTYIVYATGKTAAEMLAIARDRLGNDRATEIVAAAGEQRRITATRLRRMLCQEKR
jgi:allantoicase